MVSEKTIRDFIDKNKLEELPDFQYSVNQIKPTPPSKGFDGTSSYNSGAIIQISYKVRGMTVRTTHHIDDDD